MVVSQYQQRSINLQELFLGRTITVVTEGYKVEGRLVYCSESRGRPVLILEGLNGRKILIIRWNIIKKEVTD